MDPVAGTTAPSDPGNEGELVANPKRSAARRNERVRFGLCLILAC
jgi:hypothetical protein